MYACSKDTYKMNLNTIFKILKLIVRLKERVMLSFEIIVTFSFNFI